MLSPQEMNINQPKLDANMHQRRLFFDLDLNLHLMHARMHTGSTCVMPPADRT